MLDIHDDAMESANHNMLAENDHRTIGKPSDTREKTSHRYLLTPNPKYYDHRHELQKFLIQRSTLIKKSF